jgi:colanic acid biosynthesis glycosyl transferase WcaI
MPRPQVARTSQPRVLFLNRSYWPDMEATGQLLTELCEGLAHDFLVEVLAGQPNSVNPLAPPDWQQLAQHRGVLIRRLKHTRFPKRHIWARLVNYFTFSLSVCRTLQRWPTPDVVVFETDPFLLAFEAQRLRQRTGCRLVGYLQDIHPDVGIAIGKIRNSFAVRRLRNSLFDVYRSCDRVVVLSEDMRQLLAAEGVCPDRISVIPNWADTEKIVPSTTAGRFRTEHGLVDKFLVMYSGNIGLTQRLSDFVAAAELLVDDARIHFAFVGRGSLESELRSEVSKRRLQNISFFDYQPREQLADSLSAADLHLVPLAAELVRYLMPSKLYGILAAGRACLTNAPAGSELHRVISDNQAGFAVPSGNVQEIASTIRRAASSPELLQTMNLNARRLAETQYSRPLCIDRFRRLLRDVLTQPRECCPPGPHTHAGHASQI